MASVVVFDLDDTLYPERDFVFSGFRAVDEWLRMKGIVSGFNEVAREFFENGARGNVFNLALGKLKVDVNAELIARLIEVYRSHAPNISLFQDANEALDRLDGKYKLGLITDGWLVAQRNKVKALRIEAHFHSIVYSDSFGREFWKPHCKSYEEIQSIFACSGNTCVYVADNPKKDFIGARQLGWKTIRVRRSGGEHSNVDLGKDYEADFEINDLITIEKFL